MDQRIEFVVRARGKEAPLAQLCREFGISRQCGYEWLRRFREVGSVSGLGERSRRPHRSPRRTPEWQAERVVALRGEYGWGARKLQVLLAREGIVLGEWTINRVLARAGLIPPRATRGQATRRFAREQPNQLHQLDFKGEYRIAEGWCYPLSLLDDHSRYLVGLWALPSQRTEYVQQALEGVFRAKGVPQALLLDRGVPWWANSNGHGLSKLGVWLMNQDIELIFGAPRHPQTRGKVERFHRTLDERTRHQGIPETLAGWRQWVPRFRREYNELRPHEALGLRPPADCYTRQNLRPYQHPPAQYHYGKAATGRLDAGGFVSLGGRRYFVCEALAGQRVRLDELEGLVVVTYRTTTLREIELRTGRSAAVTLPPRKVSPMSC